MSAEVQQPDFGETTMHYSTNEPYFLSTQQFAELNCIVAQSVRARLSRTGSYFGVRPKKLANGRTAWPSIQVLKGA